MLPGAFERISNNLYQTPRSAIEPLIRFIEDDDVRTFAEPCCGNGAIIDVLEDHWLNCISRTDISMGIDARTIDYASLNLPDRLDAIITNPPYDRSRKMMRAIIDNLRRQAPTWVLLEADFAYNRSSVELMDYCDDIVAIGRIKWIKDSKNTGTANYAWYKFGARPASMIGFHPRAVSRTPTLL
jgi:hypothetical protein